MAALAGETMAAAATSEVLRVRRLVPQAAIPVRGSQLAAGFDLAAAAATKVPARGKAIVQTGLAVAVPLGTYARIAPRSGLAVKRMINCGAGVVDFDYRGEVGVVLFNHGAEDFEVAHGDRIAQLVLERISMARCVEVEQLSETTRGAGGFGSTGVADPVAAAAATSTGVPAVQEEAIKDLQVKRLRPEAVLPTRGSEHAAGFDLSAAEAVTVPAGGKAIVKTGLAIAIPEGTYARIAPRSGLAAKKMLNCGAGVVDYDYRGEVGVVLFNHGSEDFQVAPGDRVAQLVLERVCMVGCVEVEQLDDTERGAGGFGSTGVTQSSPLAAAGAAPALVGAPSQAASAMQVKRLSPTAVLPVRGSEHAAGFDLAAAEPVTVKAGDKAIVKTGLAIAIPPNTYARLAPRSGLAAKRMLHVGAGVVDFDYRGEVGVVLFNHGPEDFEVAVGDRVAQLILQEISMAPCLEVDALDDTTRGAGGFGSTGMAAADAPAPPNKRPKVEEESGSAPKLEQRVASVEEAVKAGA